ncbi:MAG: glycosyltransferase [Verrucomicrobiaceae bacterium]|nr:glycosyltransferase [Verrucomicrobiaceae bacterium]
MSSDSSSLDHASRGRILLVAHNFPPTSGPESGLVRLNTLDLLRRGWRVSVMTTTMDHMHQGVDRSMLDNLPADLEIIRTPSYDAVLRKRWPRLARVVLTILHYWLLPEVFLLWLFSAVPAGRRWLRQNGPAIIYSRATKHASNVTGWFLKRTTGLPWVAHMSDPWLGWPLNRFQDWLGSLCERRIFRDADAIVFVSAKLADHVLKPYPWVRSKVRVIPHGYAPLNKPPSLPTGAGTRPLRALHAGSFAAGLREPGTLFAGLALLNKRRPLAGRIEVMCVGEDTVRYQGDVDALGLAGVVILRSSVPFSECQTMIDSADLLLVIDSPGHGGMFLPTKLIEYLPYERPVLGLAEPESTVHELLRECDLDFADLRSPEHIAGAFERLLERWDRAEWGVSMKMKEAAVNYRIDRVNERLDELFLSLVQPPK